MAEEKNPQFERRPEKPPAQNTLPLEGGAQRITPPALNESDSNPDHRGGGFLGRMNQRFQDVLHTSRGAGTKDLDPAEASPVQIHGRLPEETPAPRPKTGKSTDKMIVPKDAVIDGSITCSSETEIAGRVTGDVIVEGRLQLSQGAVVAGNVKAVICRIEGTVEGNIECSQDLELGQTGQLKAQVLGGNRVIVAGQITGNLRCAGILRLVSTARINGDVKTRKIVVEEGAMFNGRCFMRPSTPQQGQQGPPQTNEPDKQTRRGG
ncbi:MAG: polymer-forming cytoskeletal protein [Candidatus Hydrogenedentes bacterium]|nr:polymer-forming cytoskeletal protein [Candidatus Hydrogenedentota bacterium]